MNFGSPTYTPYNIEATEAISSLLRSRNKVDKDSRPSVSDRAKVSNTSSPVMQPPLEIREEIKWNDFASIANPLGAPKSITSALSDAILSPAISYTPDMESHQIRDFLARHFGMKTGNFLCGSSVADMIRAVAQTYQPCSVGIIAPSRPEYALAASNAGHRIVDLTSPSSFVAPEPDSVRMYGMNFDAAILANPSYPSSRLLPEGTLTRYLRSCKWVIVDERSIELTLDGESYISLIDQFNNLIVVRSLSETYGISGIPMSYCVAQERTINQISQFYDNNNVSLFSEIIASVLPGQKAYLDATKDLLESEIPWMQCMLNLIPGISIFPSEANYVMCEFVNDGNMNLRVANADDLASQLQLRGYLINRIDNIPGLSESRYFCISVRTRQENEGLIRTIKQIVLGK